MKNILFFITLFLFTYSLHAQDESPHEFAISGGFGVSTLNYGVLGGSNPLRFGGQVAAEYMYYLGPRFSVGTGLELGFYRNDPKLGDGLNMLTPIYSENTCYDCVSSEYDFMNLRVYGFKEKQRTTMLNIPIMVQYLQPIKGYTQLYFRGGVKIGIALASQYHVNIKQAVTSRFKYSIEDGYYYWSESSWDNDGYGAYPVQNDMSYSGTNKLKTSFSVAGEAGVRFRLSDGIRMYVGGYIDYGLNNIRPEKRHDGLLDYFDNSKPCPPCPSRAGEQLAAEFSTNRLPGDYPYTYSLLQQRQGISAVRLVSYGLRIRFTIGRSKPRPNPEPQIVYVDRIVERIVERVVEIPVPVIVPTPILTPEEEGYLLTPVIFTQINRYTLSPENQEIVDGVAAIMKRHPWLKLRIEGRTCDIDTEEYNLGLGRRRAQSVYDRLIKNGISADRLEILSLGESDPVYPNTSEYNRSQNRRADFREIQVVVYDMK